MKTCPGCQAKNADDAAFCNECGASLEGVAIEAEVKENVAAQAVETVKNNKKYIICAAVAVVVIILLIALCGGGYKKTIKKYFAAIKSGDEKVITESTFPAKMIKEQWQERAEDNDYDITYANYLKGKTKVNQAFIKALKKEQGALKVEYEIKKAKDVNDLKKSEQNEYGIEDLEDLQDKLEDLMDDFGFDGSKVKKAYIVEVKYDIKGGKKKLLNDKTEVVAYKYGGKWYVTGLPTFDRVAGAARSNDKMEDSYEAYKDALEDFKDSYQ